MIYRFCSYYIYHAFSLATLLWSYFTIFKYPNDFSMLMVSIIEPVSYQNINFPTERFGTKFESNLSQFYVLMFTV